MNKKDLLNSYFHIKSIKTPLAICNITGISISFDLPFIPNHTYEYNNPLAYPSNARNLMAENYSSFLSNISPNIIAGCFLSIANQLSLIEDKLSAIERNLLLCEIPLFHLASYTRFLATLTVRQADRLPHFSFESVDIAHSTTFLSLKNYVDNCRDILETPIDTKSTVYIVKATKQYKHTNLTVEIRKQARELLSYIIEERLITTNLTRILKIVVQKDNLITISSSLREKIVIALKSIEHNVTHELAKIIEDIGKNRTIQETIIETQLEKGSDISMEYHNDNNIPSIKLSLTEILDRKKHPEKYVQIQNDEIQEPEDNYIDTLEEQYQQDKSNNLATFISQIEELNQEIEQEQSTQKEYENVKEEEEGDNDVL